jgi:chorismate dehydratase
VHRIASVSFLNSKPLIEGLDRAPDVALQLEVPSKLLGGLREGRADVALLPVIDYQRLEGLTILPAGGIGSDGPTLTVRVFSRVPIDEIRTLACDPDSHTSVALARIILSRGHRMRPEFIDLRNASDDPHQARLLIGDKVVCEEPRGFEHQLDLGAEWKALTGMPFVFATWMARGDVDHAALFKILERAKLDGMSRIDSIVREHAVPLGWPVDLARQYLTENLRFDVGERELEAIRLFHRFAAEERMIDLSPRSLHVFSP